MYCNFTEPTTTYGILFGQYLTIDGGFGKGEFGNLAELEVWGCKKNIKEMETFIKEEQIIKRKDGNSNRVLNFA